MSFMFAFSCLSDTISVQNCIKANGENLSIRTKNDIREGLRVTLQRLEQTIGLVDDAQAMAELKRIVLIRIAELDAAEALNPVIENPKT